MSELPQGWIETTLENNIVDIAMGPFGSNLKVDSFVDDGVPVIKGGNLSEYYVGGKFSFVTEEKADSLKRSVAYPRDIIITHRGTLGQVSLVPLGKYSRYVTSQSQLRFTPDINKVDGNYLLYFLKSRIGQYELLKNASQVGVPAIATPTKAIKSINLLLPSLIEQKVIAKILLSFDEKIALLCEQNETLETLAQMIFKEWFVNFNYPDASGEMLDSEVPEGWKVERLGDVLEIKRGGSPRPIKDYISNSGYRWLKISDATATKSPFIFEIKEHIKKEGLNKTTLLKKGALILSNSATPGIPKFLEVDSCIHDGWLHFPKTDVFSYLYLYLFFKHIRRPLLQHGNGSVFKNLKTDILKNWIVTIPDEQTMRKFDDLIQPVFEKIKNNASQIQTLSKIRDTLLPKLMNGEIRVEGFEQ